MISFKGRMSDPFAEHLSQLLSNTLRSENSIREAAEHQLQEMQKLPSFLETLFWIAFRGATLEVQIAAAIHMRRTIKRPRRLLPPLDRLQVPHWIMCG